MVMGVPHLRRSFYALAPIRGLHPGLWYVTPSAFWCVNVGNRWQCLQFGARCGGVRLSRCDSPTELVRQPNKSRCATLQNPNNNTTKNVLSTYQSTVLVEFYSTTPPYLRGCKELDSMKVDFVVIFSDIIKLFGGYFQTLHFCIVKNVMREMKQIKTMEMTKRMRMCCCCNE